MDAAESDTRFGANVVVVDAGTVTQFGDVGCVT